jgi:uncharacterized membrane protein YcaP (DUF421 family)
MVESLFGEGRELHAAQMAARAFVVFFIALALARLAGMRAFGHKSAFDAIVVIMLGAVLSRAIVGVSPFWSTVGAATVLALVHRVLAILGVRVPGVDSVIKGSVAVLYENGVLDQRVMLRFGISQPDVEAAVRQSGLARLTDVQAIYKEADGTLSVINYSPTARRSRPVHHADPPA